MTTLNLKQKLPILGLATVLVATMACGSYLNLKIKEDNRQLTNKIKTGKAILFCNTTGYYKKISPEKLVKIEEFEGTTTFYFTNGQAKQCYVEEK